jgi:hypothetical protein
MLNIPFQAQLTIAIAKRASKFRFQPAKILDFPAHICQLVFEHGLHVGTSVILLPQRQQSPDFGQREPQLLSMADELEVANLLPLNKRYPPELRVAPLMSASF